MSSLDDLIGAVERGDWAGTEPFIYDPNEDEFAADIREHKEFAKELARYGYRVVYYYESGKHKPLPEWLSTLREHIPTTLWFEVFCDWVREARGE